MSDIQYKITIISVGPGAKDLITIRGQEAINEQDIIIGFRESLDTFAAHKQTYSPDRMRTGTIEFIEQNHDKKDRRACIRGCRFFQSCEIYHTEIRQRVS